MGCLSGREAVPAGSVTMMRVHRRDGQGRPSVLERPFTCWSLRKLADYLATDVDRQVIVGRERLRQILRRNEVSWQRTRRWKESKDPDFDTKLDRIEEVTTQFPTR